MGNRPRKGEQPSLEWSSDKKTLWFLVLPAEFTILRQIIKLSHKNNGPCLHAVLCSLPKTVLPSPPQSLITTLAGNKAEGTSLCYR